MQNVIKRFTLPCPARHGIPGDYFTCGDPIVVAVSETPDGLAVVEEIVAPCQYHSPGNAWDSPFTMADLEALVDEGKATEVLLADLERPWTA